MASLLSLSNELLHNVIVNIDPRALDALSLTCRATRAFIKDNRLLTRSIYLGIYDDPAKSPNDRELPWAAELRRHDKFWEILGSEDSKLKHRALPFLVRNVIRLLSTADTDGEASHNVALLKDAFAASPNTDGLLYHSCIFGLLDDQNWWWPETTTDDSKTERLLCSKLRALYGSSTPDLPRKARDQLLHYSRSIIYDLRGYTEWNMWGPFLDERNGDPKEGLKVDWEKIEAIMVDLSRNMKHFSEHHGVEIVWDGPFVGVTGRQVPTTPWTGEPTPKMPVIRQPEPSIDAKDPYGITGTWRRVVCFLDYNDFYLFNFRDNVEHPEGRHPICTEEAIRLITLKLYATKIEAPGEGDSPNLPVVHFRGSSQSMHPSWDPQANSAIRAFQGTVRLTKEGEIRWTTLSIFHGEPRWKSEGIQVGGLRSKRGVIGTWFDKDYDRQGPCGPTAFWKLSDDIEEHGEQGTPPQSFVWMAL